MLSKDIWLERTAKMLSFNPKSLLRKHTKWSKTWDTGGMVDFQRKVFEKDEFEPRRFSSIAWRALERFSILSKKDEAGLGNHHWRKLSSTNRTKQALTIVVLKSCPKHLIVPRQHCFSMVHKTIGCRMRSIHHISCQMLHCVTEMSTELFVLSNFVIVFIISTTKVITSIIRRCTGPLLKHTFSGKLVTFA